MIQLIDVHKSFGSKKVLEGVDLEIKDGESMVVIGGSGSGKSVLIKHIIGLLKPDRGTVLVDGIDISDIHKEKELNKIRKKFGMLFQYAALFDSMTVWENVSFAVTRLHRTSPEEARHIASEKLSMVGLVGVEDLMPSELSGGMKKRVGLARAIAHDPKILIFDEPTTGLDPIMADVINNLIVDVRKHLTATSIAITHDMVSAYKIADRIAMLYNGKIIEIGTPEEVRNTTNPVVKQFIEGSAQGPIQVSFNLRENIGHILMRITRATERDIQKAVATQRREGHKRRIGEILVGSIITEKELTRALSELFDIPIVSEDKLPSDVVVKSLPYSFLMSNSILPIGIRDNTLDIAIYDPLNTKAIDEVRESSGHNVNLFLTQKSLIESKLAGIYESQEKAIK